MLNVVLLNPGDEFRRHGEPPEVHTMAHDKLGKFLQARIGTFVTAIIVDTEAKVPHPYDPNATISLKGVERLCTVALRAIGRLWEGLQKVSQQMKNQDSRAAYEARLAKDRTTKVEELI